MLITSPADVPAVRVRWSADLNFLQQCPRGSCTRALVRKKVETFRAVIIRIRRAVLVGGREVAYV